jgi:cytosine/adenosine deaminase-related metal-dependent hydrolase
MAGTFDGRDFIAGGYIIEHGQPEPCTVIREDGSLSIDPGLPDRSDFTAYFIRDMVNGHTHCADYGLRIPPGMSMEELVAPPNGLKHRYLSGLDGTALRKNISAFSTASAGHGSASFIDFREGGVEGCRALRDCCPDALILGRPVSDGFDPEEMAELLSVADGIGLPSISDMDQTYIESVADDVRRARKVMAIHVSERVREDIDFVLSLDPAFVVHMCEATDSDMSKCAEAEVPVVVCPTANLYFGKEVPIVRMFDCGLDVALGTDNGMLCEPDLVSESTVLSGLISRQGGDPEDVWKTLSNFTGKLLYRTSRMEGKIRERYLTVIPVKTVEAPVLGPSTPFRVTFNRGESRYGVQ